MTRRLPSTTALLAFESAARHESFARAAHELSLTEGAISRQVAKLEDFLGVRLFHRVSNRVELSAPGTRYANEVRELLERLERQTRQFMTDAQGNQTLELGVIPTMASRWLIPRITGFHKRHPDIEINLRARTQPFALNDSELHAAISIEHPAWIGMQVQPLFQEPLIAVCHPTLVHHTPAHIPLLHKHGVGERWAQYASLSGMNLPNTTSGPNYDRYSLLIEAARSGIGMALVPRLYVEEDIILGRLSSPWPGVPELAERFVLVTRPDTLAMPAIEAFREWLLDEV